MISNFKKYVLSVCCKVRSKLDYKYRKLDKIDNDFWVYVSNSDLEGDSNV